MLSSSPPLIVFFMLSIAVIASGDDLTTPWPMAWLLREVACRYRSPTRPHPAGRSVSFETPAGGDLSERIRRGGIASPAWWRVDGSARLRHLHQLCLAPRGHVTAARDHRHRRPARQRHAEDVPVEVDVGTQQHAHLRPPQ